jgi:hypothetical protein
MGDRSHFRRSTGLRFLLRLASVVAALFVLGVSGRASAATTNVVPMCGDHNESIAAPPIFRLSDGGSIRALPCRTALELGFSQTAPAAPERVLVYECPERAIGFTSLLIAQSESSRVFVSGASRAVARPGFVGTLFRPPCA